MVKNDKKAVKSRKQLDDTSELCYVGIRESDFFYDQNTFCKSVCLFSSNPEAEPFDLRLNQNIDHKDMLPYLKKKLSALIEKSSSLKLIFYNQATAYHYPEALQQRAICINSLDLLNFINNKLTLKKWFVENGIPVIPYETFLGKDILFSKLTKRFQNCQNFVVQSNRGGGGVGTFLAEASHFSMVTSKLQKLQQYIVSPYIPSISANTHVFIAEKQTVLSPGSIQIVEVHDNQLCYRGGDFAAFRSVPSAVREEIKRLSFVIADLLRKKGYRGIAGIDFIIDNQNNVFCSEINPRFQASTLLIDQFLKNRPASEAGSCFELNQMAFEGCMISTLCYEDNINTSCYYYYNDILNPAFFMEKYNLLKKSGITVFDDGMTYYMEQRSLNSDSYLFRAIFPHAISKISPDTTLWINDNIPVREVPANNLELKISLLNQGGRIDNNISEIKDGVYESIDILTTGDSRFQAGIPINCAYGIHLSKYSPYSIRMDDKKEKLYYYNEFMTEVVVEKNQLNRFSKLTRQILFLATDRLRIKLIAGCENKNMGRGCQFCNLPVSETNFTLEEIKNALLQLQAEKIEFRHILIGGGSCLAPDAWEKIVSICDFLKRNDFYKAKPISIMTMLPPIEMLSKLKQAGVEELAFNLEIADDTLAQKLMPGKRSYGKDSYYEIFQAAVKIFGIGKVRSALIAGLDQEQDLYDEIHTLAEIGVLPCLSAFRALPNSDFADQLGPDNQYLIKVYQNAAGILHSLSGEIQELGPDCMQCRNNMLAL